MRSRILLLGARLSQESSTSPDNSPLKVGMKSEHEGHPGRGKETWGGLGSKEERTSDGLHRLGEESSIEPYQLAGVGGWARCTIRLLTPKIRNRKKGLSTYTMSEGRNERPCAW